MGQLGVALRTLRSNVNLFRAIAKCQVAFDPYDYRSVSAREFLRRVNSPRVRRANPRLVVEATVRDGGGSGGAELVISFLDGRTLTLQPLDVDVKTIEREIALNIPVLTIYKLFEEETSGSAGFKG
ncbi:hypothetical protein CYME_CMC090C [Cyanidioschyzon merolae strain 10D]|jgi:hypothetical protein|uniref:Large ribosomal subunit protein mL53 n=1 Tax=Cyanidioschyzon merolae (strain NIES-3377 / 10D) TaxID=280699 RepID=M1V6K7_CYAM1|nr:hypothetical protein CYME_CMC090C [Cyanidioschyzon merolae strain 10D]BAM79024.1 hypothetical protein CYME_CMC090C [Cyanidioschyzon merolae strain 10D]|eukprot:XP_005535310.1 hypothetical protein CYME_CMC090C [Cyanidioschyzon merolae strain 10D]